MLELAVQPELADTNTTLESTRAARTFMSDEPRNHGKRLMFPSGGRGNIVRCFG